MISLAVTIFGLWKDKDSKKTLISKCSVTFSSQKIPQQWRKKDNHCSFLLISEIEELPGILGNHREVAKLTLGFPYLQDLFSSWRMLQGDFQSQKAGVGCPGISSVVTQCGCQKQVIRAVSDSVTNNFLGFPSEILLPSFHSSSCSSYAAYSWGTMFCCISNCNIEILLGGFEKKCDSEKYGYETKWRKAMSV